ncbi:hypothetical protein IAQ61_003204 [Plenodomus lingam]|uniref:uncharacterized protein n=1 Tax=Leptosphaeria maculans TaxID=5022 RepID=UPI00332EE066|nr:hypothetical protein IAQ61_003204 [Plenodomus lingam]
MLSAGQGILLVYVALIAQLLSAVYRSRIRPVGSPLLPPSVDKYDSAPPEAHGSLIGGNARRRHSTSLRQLSLIQPELPAEIPPIVDVSKNGHFLPRCTTAPWNHHDLVPMVEYFGLRHVPLDKDPVPDLWDAHSPVLA